MSKTLLAVALVAGLFRGCGGLLEEEQSGPDYPLDVQGYWELAYDLPPEARGFPTRLTVRLAVARDRYTVVGVVVRPLSRAFVSGRVVGPVISLGIGPVETTDARIYYENDATFAIPPHTATGTASIRVLVGETKRVFTGSLRMIRVDERGQPAVPDSSQTPLRP